MMDDGHVRALACEYWGRRLDNEINLYGLKMKNEAEYHKARMGRLKVPERGMEGTFILLDRIEELEAMKARVEAVTKRMRATAAGTPTNWAKAIDEALEPEDKDDE